MAETNDALIAALCVWTIVAAQRPVTRGLLIAAAALTKFVPALLTFQFLGVKRRPSRYPLTLVASLAGMLAWPLITSGAVQFLDSTLATCWYSSAAACSSASGPVCRTWRRWQHHCSPPPWCS
jgi:hypothetical protein